MPAGASAHPGEAMLRDAAGQERLDHLAAPPSDPHPPVLTAPDSLVASRVAAFGEGIRGAPRAAGLGLGPWALPAVVVGAGGIAVMWWAANPGRARGGRDHRVRRTPPWPGG